MNRSGGAGDGREGSPAIGRLDASWRGAYIESASAAERAEGAPVPGAAAGCVFCAILASCASDAEARIVHRASHTLAILNAYPYTSGHLMCMPLRHVGEIEHLTTEEQSELWEQVRRSVVAVKAAYHPDGINLGVNLGRAAGAGVPGHLHVHVVPRWNGDTNFMTTVAEVRVVPESLDVTWTKLSNAWPQD